MLFAILSSIVVLALMIMKKLTDEQWLRICPLFPRKDLEHSGAGRPRQPVRDALFPGCCAQVLAGMICQIAFHRIKPVIADYSSGSAMG